MDTCNCSEVIFRTVIGERFQKLQDFYLVLEDSLSTLFIAENGFIQDFNQSADTINFNELRIAISMLQHAYFSEINRSMLLRCILIVVSLLSKIFILSSNSFFLCSSTDLKESSSKFRVRLNLYSSLFSLYYSTFRPCKITKRCWYLALNSFRISNCSGGTSMLLITLLNMTST